MTNVYLLIGGFGSNDQRERPGTFQPDTINESTHNHKNESLH